MKVPKLYLITRKDLSLGLRTAQLCHAFREYVEQYPEMERLWYTTSNTVVVIDSFHHEQALAAFADKLRSRGVSVAEFREPDLDNALTALAVGPEGSSMCKHFRLLK